MDIDQTQTNNTKMDVDTTAVTTSVTTDASAVPSLLTPLHTSLASLCSSSAIKSSLDAILKNLLKLFSALKKNPNLLANRKFRCDNIAIKKFIMDVSGALEIMKFVGYQQQELTG